MYTIVSFKQRTIIFFGHLYYLNLPQTVNFCFLKTRIMKIGNKITQLRKKQNWSQTQLANKIEVSRVIIGRYERDEAAPSIEIAKKIADAFGVSLDYLAGEGKLSNYNKDVLQRMEDIEHLDNDTRSKLFFLIDNVIQNFKTKQAFGNAS